MHDMAWLPVLGSALSAIPSCAAAFSAWLAYKSSLRNRDELKNTNEKVAQVAEKVEQVHLATNSMKDQLVAATDAAAHARGVTEATEAAAAAADRLAVAHAEGRAEERGKLPPDNESTAKVMKDDPKP